MCRNTPPVWRDNLDPMGAAKMTKVTVFLTGYGTDLVCC